MHFKFRLPNIRRYLLDLAQNEFLHFIISLRVKHMQKKEVTYEAVNQFIIAIKCCAIEEIKRLLQEYNSIIVNRLQTQTRQPALYFSSILIDHEISFNIMKLLISHGANPHFKDSYQQTVLFYVCRQGKQKCLDLLLEQGLNLQEEDLFGQTPLFYAAKENRLNIIHKLIDKRANPNHTDKIAQQNPLFYAAREGHLEMCKILIEAGCELSHQDTAHRMASHYAKKYGKNEVFDYLANEYQNLKDQKKIQIDSRQESNIEDRGAIKKAKRKDTIQNNIPVKTMYRLYRSDNFGNANEVSINQYEQLLQNYSDLEQLLRNPEEIDISGIEEIKAREAWVKVAQKVLTVCWKSKGGYFFHQPVDPSKYGIDDYFEVIEQPMDFGTIKKKLTFNVYNNVQEFSYDMKLVFDNCVKYNGIENQIAKHAIQIKNLFEQNMKQTGYMN